jgi:hypothetical protein
VPSVPGEPGRSAGGGRGAPELDKLRVYYNHPGFLEPQVDLIADALAELPEEVRAEARIVFTTHSIPHTMSRHCDYEAQHYEACRIVMEAFEGRPWDLVYNSRSGPAFVPWLEPDVNDHLEALAEAGVPGVVVVPIGFISDHMEVIYDLDVEAKDTAQRLGLPYARAGTVGVDPRFVAMIRELVLERRRTRRHGRSAPAAPTTTPARSTAASPPARNRGRSSPRRSRGARAVTVAAAPRGLTSLTPPGVALYARRAASTSAEDVREQWP